MHDREYAARVLAFKNAGETIPPKHLTPQEQRIVFAAIRKNAPASRNDAPVSDESLPAVACGGSYL